jgi:hypothetical protein
VVRLLFGRLTVLANSTLRLSNTHHHRESLPRSGDSEMRIALALVFVLSLSVTVRAGAVFAPHHTAGDGFHEKHYFAETGDSHHFAWFSVTPATVGTITIKYDFRDIGVFPNLITVAQKARAVDALDAFSAATDGGTGPKLVFVQDTVAAITGIVNIGTGNLAALSGTSGVGGTLGLGGGAFGHLNPSIHSISSGAAWQDSADTWDTVIGNGNPSGTFDYFTVVVQEIGHALGLGHTDNTGSTNMMNGSYGGEQTGLSAIDVAHIRSVYGVSSAAVVPEPSSLGLVGFALLGLIGGRYLKKRPRRRD